MKLASKTTHTRLGYKALGALVSVLCTSSQVLAADLTWQGKANNGTKGDIWDTSNKNWGANTIFSNSSAHNVIFGAPGDHTVKIEGTLTPNNVTINSGQAFSFSPLNSTTGVIQASGTTQINGSLTLLANPTLHIGSTAFLSSASGITVSNTGSLILAGTGNHIGNQTNLTLAGGTLRINNSGAEEMGALTLSTTSTLDFLGAGSSLTFSSITTSLSGSSLALNITNWNSGDHLYLKQTPSSNITFNFYDNQGARLSNVSYEVVPEPSTVLAGVGLVGLIGWRERRRIASLTKRNRSSASLQTA